MNQYTIPILTKLTQYYTKKNKIFKINYQARYIYLSFFS